MILHTILFLSFFLAAFINEGKLTNIEEIAGHLPQSKHVNSGGVSCITSGHIHRPEFQWRGESPKMVLIKARYPMKIY